MKWRVKEMKRISVDNGHSFVEPEEALERVPMTVIIEYMDTEAYIDTVMNGNYTDNLGFLLYYLANAPADLIIG